MLAAIGHALMMSFTMTWEILWTLILGFWLSAIQAVVSKEEMSLKTIIGFDGLADISFL